MKNPFKRLNYWFQTGFYSALFLAVLIFIFLLAAPFNQVYDFSVGKRYSFSQETKQMFEGVQQEKIQLVSFFKEGDPVIREVESLTASLKRYLPRLTFMNYDIEKNPDKAREYGVHRIGDLLIEMKGRQAALLELNESGLKETFQRLLVKRRPVIFFTNGHRETQITDTGTLGYSFAKDRLLNSTFVVKQDFIDSPAFSEADVVVIAYPKKDFSSYEIERLREHLSYKSAVLMIDPEEEGIYPSLRRLIAEHGVELGDNVVMDRTSRMYGADDLIPVVTNFSNHTIVKGFDAPLFFPLSRSVHMTESRIAELWEMDYLLYSGDESWGERNYRSLEQGNYAFNQAEDIKGPLPLALALERKDKPYNRIVVFGDSDFMNNTNFNAGGNQLLFLNTISWVLKEELALSERGAAAHSEPWIIPEEKRLWIFLSTAVIPSIVCFLLLGGFFTLRRLLT